MMTMNADVAGRLPHMRKVLLDPELDTCHQVAHRLTLYSLV